MFNKGEIDRLRDDIEKLWGALGAVDEKLRVYSGVFEHPFGDGRQMVRGYTERVGVVIDAILDHFGLEISHSVPVQPAIKLIKKKGGDDEQVQGSEPV